MRAGADGYILKSVELQEFDRTRQSGAEMIRLKGDAGWVVGISIATLVHAIVLDQKKILPVSSLQTGAYGIRDICLSVPTLVSRSGILQHAELELWPRELQGLKSSANTLQETFKRLEI
jgi:L-lactate dehydrogenase